MRAHNERLVLSLLRRNGQLAKAEIARLTGLSAQTISVIMRALEADGLIARGEPRRGRVGQPSVPMHLAPGGAYFLGLKVGRRSLQLVLVDFLGKVLGQVHETHRVPTPSGTLDFVRQAVPDLLAKLGEADRERVAGLGIGMPFYLWDWAEPIGVPESEMAVWRDTDLRADIAAEVPFPVFMENDASAACSAEIVFGAPARPDGLRDFVYAYIGYFAGGGLVLNGRLITGRKGNAGALGSMPVPAEGGGSVQLLDVASLSALEALLVARGLDARAMWESPVDWAIDPGVLALWTARAAAGLAHVAASGAALLDLEALVIDGWMPDRLRATLIEQTQAALSRIDLSGATPPEVVEGTIGPGARALGAASLPLSMRYLVEPGTLGTQG
ncbi:ROK family transcriptional regulator [Tropicimonas isoalkanivorans]|nr:ROK family transcriptional regulator [Tropicimonas isoalkanivorans]